MGDPALPVLLVVHDEGSAAPMRILAAARGLCRVVLLCEPDRPRVAEGLRSVGRHAEIADVTGLDTEAVCRLAAGFDPAGVVTFSERRLRLTASVAEACGLPFHPGEAVDVLTDKFRQRRALAEHGVQDTRCAVVGGGGRTADGEGGDGSGPDADGLDAVLDRVGLPAVLKPRAGAGSVDTCLVRSADECRSRLAEFTEGRDDPGEFVLEEYLPGDPGQAGPGWGDYVSVESVVVDGEPRTVAVTGKLPLAPPFRETGHLLPAPLPPEAAADVVRLERRALRALGVRHGVTHTEIKLTPAGPRVIEVNGRLGGHMAELVQRSLGYDLVAAALRLALGLPVESPEPPRGSGRGTGRGGVAFHFKVVPPPGAPPPDRTSLVERLMEVPGVDLVDLADLTEIPVPSGWRAGTAGAVGVVYGSAADHAELRKVLDRLRELLDEAWRTPEPEAPRSPFAPPRTDVRWPLITPHP
ncbi:ATP-grasp domain-containing protein [Streptomyces venezuelae]|uniref:ATP-grasp domain-containing protein n=1 Tax=Streptomyces venezuelae TaxID=54571 RepID=UPI00278BF7F2|nr:ATP-grasp domain-containing protein [Streptomyces venezuelae]